MLSLRRLTHRANEEARWEVAIDLRFPPVPPPSPPDRALYELRVKSRYGLVRRALVFFSGVADVVYSSQHVALMSQNFHVPTSVLVRRLSLVFLVSFVVIVDMIFHVRRAISEVILAWIRGGGHAGRGAAPSGFESFLGTALGFGVWLAIYGSIYLVLYLSIRRRYEVNVRRLRSMAAGEAENMQRIHRRHLADLVRWGAEYGRSLDSAVELTLRHAEALIDHYGHRLRRRIAGPALLDAAKTIADGLFAKLPEAKGDLLDAATTQTHSLAHWVWPRAEEMEYQVRLAQYRAAWQHLELAVSDLRREQPDPVLSHELWRAAISYAAIFAPFLPDEMARVARAGLRADGGRLRGRDRQGSRGARPAPRGAPAQPGRAARGGAEPGARAGRADQQPDAGDGGVALRGDHPRAGAGAARGDGVRDLSQGCGVVVTSAPAKLRARLDHPGAKRRACDAMLGEVGLHLTLDLGCGRRESDDRVAGRYRHARMSLSRAVLTAEAQKEGVLASPASLVEKRVLDAPVKLALGDELLHAVELGPVAWQLLVLVARLCQRDPVWRHRGRGSA